MVKEKSFSFLTAQLMRRLNLLNRDQIVCYGVTLAQCHTIDTLHRKGLLSMNELSRQQGVSVSTMTRGIDVLVRDEIVERVDSPGDRRKVCIRLTEKGNQLAAKLKQCTDSYSIQILEQIPEDKRVQVMESLILLIDAIGGVNEKCCT
jgi:DNA-binding MarR family transcriptional regulator